MISPSAVVSWQKSEYPGVAQMVGRVVWECVTPPARRRNPKSPEALETLAIWCFIPSAKSPKIAV